MSQMYDLFPSLAVRLPVWQEWNSIFAPEFLKNQQTQQGVQIVLKNLRKLDKTKTNKQYDKTVYRWTLSERPTKALT